MLRKRFIGVITVRQGWAVQSFGYNRYLPIGGPEVLLENLDRWGADEILLQCIDRSGFDLGPDFDFLKRVGELGLSTPLVYAGGLRSADDAAKSINLCADRVMFDALLRDRPDEVYKAGRELGAQALIACLPLTNTLGGVRWHDYRTGEDELLPANILEMLETGMVSEALVVDWMHEGLPRGFDAELLTFGQSEKVPLIAFGGISDPKMASDLFGDSRLDAVAIGNFLTYGEHVIQHFKNKVEGVAVRPAHYQTRNWFA